MSEFKVKNVISLWMLLLLLLLALAKPLLSGAQATLLARLELRLIVLISQMQQMVTRCIFLLVTQRLTGFFTLIIANLSLERVSPESIVLYFHVLMLRLSSLRQLFPSCLRYFPTKPPFPYVYRNFSLPNKLLLCRSRETGLIHF